MSTNKITPFDLVRVLHEGYSHVGEAVSYPDENHRVMVRMVPGEPATVVDMPLSRLVPYTGEKLRWVHYAEVAGSGQFPVDMLRYDSAAPVNFTLAEDEHGRIEVEPEREGEPLIIARATATKRKPWTDGRWSSFNWGVAVAVPPKKLG